MAIQWKGTWESVPVIHHFTNGSAIERHDLDFKRSYLFLVTPGGEIMVSPRDWVIKAPNGSITAMKPDLFIQTYYPLPSGEIKIKSADLNHNVGTDKT